MKLTYSGKTKDFTPELEAKLSATLEILSKVTEQRREREIHLIHTMERQLHKVELTMNFYDHGLVGEGMDGDLLIAANHAVDKLEKQLLKASTRWRDTHRVRSEKGVWEDPTSTAAGEDLVTEGKNGANGSARKPKIFRVNHNDGRKPMTLEQALLEMDTTSDYLVYRDVDRDCLSVLVRRPDGNFDLIES